MGKVIHHTSSTTAKNDITHMIQLSKRLLHKRAFQKVPDWLSFTKASDQGRRAVLQLPRPGARSCLQVAHKGNTFHRKLKGWPDSHLCLSRDDATWLATYCHVLLLIKEHRKTHVCP